EGRGPLLDGRSHVRALRSHITIECIETLEKEMSWFCKIRRPAEPQLRSDAVFNRRDTKGAEKEKSAAISAMLTPSLLSNCEEISPANSKRPLNIFRISGRFELAGKSVLFWLRLRCSALFVSLRLKVRQKICAGDKDFEG